MTLWTPDDLGTAPDLWLDASDNTYLYDATSGGSNVVADGSVARWEDRSGNAKHATQATSGDRPLYKTSIIGGLGVVRFDGSSDDFDLVSITQAYPLHVFCIYAAGSLGTGFRALIDRSTSAPPYPPAVYFGSSGYNKYPSIYWGTSTYVGPAAVSSASIVEWRLGTTSLGFRINGASSESTKSHSLSAASSWTTVNNGAVQQSAVDIGELLIVQYALSADERQRMEGYLAHKWGLEASLPGSHPYYTDPPTLSTGAAAKLVNGGLVNSGLVNGGLVG